MDKIARKLVQDEAVREGKKWWSAKGMRGREEDPVAQRESAALIGKRRRQMVLLRDKRAGAGCSFSGCDGYKGYNTV